MAPPSTPNSLLIQGQQLIETTEDPAKLLELLTKFVLEHNCGTADDAIDVINDWGGNAYNKKTMIENWIEFINQ